jgi:iron complex transport system substrate-binding protein
MKSFISTFIFLFAALLLSSCKQNNARSSATQSPEKNEIQYAKGLELYKRKGYSILKITHPRMRNFKNGIAFSFVQF